LTASVSDILEQLVRADVLYNINLIVLDVLHHLFSIVGKLLTLGGVGIWWIVDIVLLVSGGLIPEDGSNWVPFM